METYFSIPSEADRVQRPLEERTRCPRGANRPHSNRILAFWLVVPSGRYTAAIRTRRKRPESRRYRLKIDQSTFERTIGWLTLTVNSKTRWSRTPRRCRSHSRVMPASLRSGFSARLPRKSPRMKTLSRDYAFSSTPVIMVEHGLNTSLAMFSAMVSYRFEKVISPTRPQSLRRRL